MSDHHDYSYPRTRRLPQESDTVSKPDDAVRELLPRALRFIAEVSLARVDDKGTYAWLRMAAGEIENLRDEVARLKAAAEPVTFIEPRIILEDGYKGTK